MGDHDESAAKLNTQVPDEPLELSKAMYGTASSLSFSNTLIRRFYPLFAAAVGTSIAEMGILRSAVNFCSNVLQIGWGSLADRWGKRFFIASGFVASGCLVTLFLFAKGPAQLIWLIIFWAIFFSMIQPAWNALLGDYTKKDTRGGVVGRVGSISALSGVVAMTIVAIFTFSAAGETVQSSFAFPFLSSAVISFAGVIFASLARERRSNESGRKFGDILIAARDKDYRRFLAVNFAYWFAMGFAWPLFPYITVDIVGATVWQMALMDAGMRLMMALTQRRFGSVLDKFGRRPVLVASSCTMCLFPLWYALARTWTQLAVANAFMGIAMSAMFVARPTYILDSAPEGKRATYAASNSVVFGLGSSIGSLTGGSLGSHLLSSTDFHGALSTGLLFSALLRLVTGLGFLLVKETSPRSTHRA